MQNLVSLPVRVGRVLVASFILTGLTTAARALVFEFADVKATFDSTLSVGGLYRLNNPDRDLYGTANGGRQNSVNTDDGNLNYRSGWASKVFKGTHDLDLRWKDFGAFVRGTYFYDVENEDGDRARTPLSEWAKDRVGSDAQFLDMYVRGTFNVASRPLELRFGRQVLNLGESTFIPNGVNVVNPVDVSRLRVPGSELREALLPVNMLKASYSFSDRLSAEAFWLLEFRRTEIDPAGTYFGTNDFAARGGDRVYLGFGALSDQQPLGAVGRDRDREGGNFNQYGANLKLTVPKLNDTEFGLYYASYHSRLPVISARTPTDPVSATLVQTTAGNLANANLAPAMIANGVPPATVATVLPQLIGAALTGVPADSLPAGLVPFAAFYPSAVSIANGARQVGLLTAAATGRYFIEYPENIKMLAASFNTTLGGTGIAWQGEIAYKHGVPLQIDDVELLFATLSALSPTFANGNNQINGAQFPLNTEISGYRRKDVYTTQSTFTKVFGPTFGSNQFTLLAELGMVYVPDLPDKNVLRFDGPGTFTSGNAAAMVNTGSPTLPGTPHSAFADRFSWGYQILGRLEYNNVFAGVNVLPGLAFVHDVSGNTPLPLGNFVAGRKSINLVAEFTFQNAWSFEVRYVNFFGAKPYNLIADRDFVSTTLKYSF